MCFTLILCQIFTIVVTIDLRTQAFSICLICVAKYCLFVLVVFIFQPLVFMLNSVAKATELAELIDGYCYVTSSEQPSSLIISRAGQFCYYTADEVAFKSRYHDNLEIKACIPSLSSTKKSSFNFFTRFIMSQKKILRLH